MAQRLDQDRSDTGVSCFIRRAWLTVCQSASGEVCTVQKTPYVVNELPLLGISHAKLEWKKAP